MAVTLALCAIGAGAGLFLGTRPPLSETHVIQHGAALFVAQTGGAATECAGVPGDGQVWIEVRCGAATNTLIYRFDRYGRQLKQRRELNA